MAVRIRIRVRLVECHSLDLWLRKLDLAGLERIHNLADDVEGMPIGKVSLFESEGVVELDGIVRKGQSFREEGAVSLWRESHDGCMKSDELSE